MAIHHLSLQLLADARRRAERRRVLADGVVQADAVLQTVQSINEQAPAAAPSVAPPPATGADSVAPDAAASVTMSVTRPAEMALPEWASSVEELLQLPRTQVAALLAEVGEPASKVWLALIYRLAALETQVKTLATELRRSAAPSTPVSAPILAVSKKSRGARKPTVEEGSKTDVLEKVFRKNLSLRKAP